MIAFLKFGSLSGLGWLLDFAILMSLVGGLGAHVFAANLVSSSLAALTVFLLSRRFIFMGGEGGLEYRVGAYFAYTLAIIAVAAGAMTLIVEALRALTAATAWRVAPSSLVVIAKIVVTPPQLVLNFLMSRLISERQLPSRAS